VLGTGTGSTAVTGLVPFSVSITVDGTPASVTFTPLANTIVAGVASSQTVAVSALDAGGNVIAGAFSAPVTLAVTDTTGTFSISPTSLTDSTTPVTLTYAGTPGATSTSVTATLSGTAIPLSGALAVTTVSGPSLYAAQSGAGGSYTVSDSIGSGDVFAAQTVSGASAFASAPSGIALAPDGRVYVASGSGISMFSGSATGNVAPTSTLSGSSTQLSSPRGIGFDSSGDLYVANNGNNTITEYAAGSTGNAAPTGSLVIVNEVLNGPVGLAVAPSGNIFVANQSPPLIGSGGSLIAFTPIIGNPVITQVITGPATGLTHPAYVTVDNSGLAYVTNQASGGTGTDAILIFASGATGDTAPTRTISGSNTGLSTPTGIALDASGNIYVANSGNATISEFANTATGNVAPLKTIAGPDTGFSSPMGIAIAPATTATSAAKLDRR
jgi:sugar lactone lactonase YvrE